MPGVASTPTFTPSPPTNLVANPSNGQISISFTPGNNKGFTITDYRYSLNGGAYSSAGTAVSPVIITGLTNGTSYSVTLKAVNIHGPGLASNTISATPITVPDAPIGIAVMGLAERAIITWNAPTNNGGDIITSYKVTSYDANGNPGQYVVTTNTSALITGLQGGDNYTFSVTATNSSGTGLASSLSSSVTIGYSCFHSSSKILALKDDEEKYISITDLKKGDLIKTYKHEYIKIFAVTKSIIKHYFSNDRLPEHLYILPKSSFHELTDDLILTGYHSILVDDMNEEQREQIAKQDKSNIIYITEDKYRLFCYLDPKAELYNKEVGEVEIWHIALENESKIKNYGIYANGLLVETLPICMIK